MVLYFPIFHAKKQRVQIAQNPRLFAIRIGVNYMNFSTLGKVKGRSHVHLE